MALESTEYVSPDGFIHLDGCTIYQCADIEIDGPGPHMAICSCGADKTDPARNVLREAISLPADGVIGTVLLDTPGDTPSA